MYNIYARLNELKEAESTRELTIDEYEEKIYCESTIAQIENERDYLNGERNI